MHNFKYTLKVLLKSKMLIFWTMAFPLILGTFFYMAFSDIEDGEKLDIIDIAIVETEDFLNNTFLKNAYKSLGSSGSDEQLFNITYVSDKEDADKLLKEDKIAGYLNVDDKEEIVIRKNGIDATILQFVTDEIITEAKMVEDIVNKSLENNMTYDMESYISGIYSKVLSKYNEDLNIKDVSRENLSYTMIEYYTLIAMTCLYGGMLGMTSVNRMLPNMGSVGKRVSISPNKKGSIIISSALSSFIVSLFGLLLLYLYTIFVLNVDYGSHFGLVVLLSVVGSFCGLSLGIFIAAVLKSNENAKVGILIGVTMFGSFLAGMMGVTMKYVVDKNMPIVNKLNPVALVTDGLYSLYYYDTFDRYIINVVSLVVISLVLLVIAMFSLKRSKYECV